MLDSTNSDEYTIFIKEVTQMPNSEECIAFVDLLALAGAALKDFGQPLELVFAMCDFQDISEQLTSHLEMIWKNEPFVGCLDAMRQVVTEIQSDKSSQRFIKALALCQWMDKRVTNTRQDKQKKLISLYDLVDYDEIKPVEIGPMNTNYQESGIQIIPKFAVCKFYDLDLKKNRDSPNPFANRDAFAGINGLLYNVSLVTYSQKNIIRNIIIPANYFETGNDNLKIAFCPMTDQSDELKKEQVLVEKADANYCGIEINGISRPDELLNRLRADWMSMCSTEKGADIVFWPEALGFDEAEATVQNGKYSKEIHQMSKEAQKQGQNPPLLTVLPSYCRDRVNSATIVYKDGQILARQGKHYPFIDIKNHRMEALRDHESWVFYIIHIPGVHRIVVMICAEFLHVCETQRSMLFDEVGATLVLVPSYSHGERDFLHALTTLQCYGTTVIWGNCCGAATGNSVIGACSVAGTEVLHRFNDREVCKCGGTCEGKKSCAFVVSLPLKFDMTKKAAADIDAIRHVIQLQ